MKDAANNMSDVPPEARGEQPLERNLEQLQRLELEILTQMAAAFTHEASQPLTVLLSNLDLLRMRRAQLDGRTQSSLEKITGAAQCLSDLIKRAQNIFQMHERDWEDTAADGAGTTNRLLTIIEDETTRLIVHRYVRESGMPFELHPVGVDELEFGRLRELAPRIILLDYSIVNGKVMRFMLELETANFEIPVVLLTESGCERALASLLREAVVDYLPKSALSRNNLQRMIEFALLRFEIRRRLKLLEQAGRPAMD